MFEKEAEEWVKENMDCCRTESCTGKDIPYFDEEERCCAKSAFKDGAEFGYNKCKEEINKNGLALQSDMDETIKQNIELKKMIEKMKCCMNCKYKDLDYSFSPICISRGWDNIRGIGNPFTFKCDEWEIK